MVRNANDAGIIRRGLASLQSFRPCANGVRRRWKRLSELMNDFTGPRVRLTGSVPPRSSGWVGSGKSIGNARLTHPLPRGGTDPVQV
jgi:hypothetical protein